MKLTLFEVIFRLIPEVFFINYAITKISPNKFDKNKYIESSLVAIVCVYIIRSLPINYGIHIILNIITLIAVSIFINKNDVVSTISSIMKVIVIMMIVEELNMLLIKFIPKEITNYILSDAEIGKTILEIPSITVYAVIAFVLYKRNKKRGENTDDKD